MRLIHVSSDQREIWNAFVAREPSFALMQSWEWGEFKEALGWRALRVGVADDARLVAGAQVLVRSLPLGAGSVAYVPRGPVGSWMAGDVTGMLLGELQRIVHEHRTVFLRIEPPLLHDPAISRILSQHRFRSHRFSNQPRATLILDLTMSLEDIQAQMRKTTRYRIRYAARNGVIVRLGDETDLPAFCALMRETGDRAGFSPRVSEYYEQEWRIFASRGQAALLLAYYEDRLLGARIIFRFADRAADLHACSTREHSDLRANWLLEWEAIKWARAHGCHTYDLWGIPDEVGQAACEGRAVPKPDRGNGLWGVYQFKRGFSQNVVYYASAHDYVRALLAYHPVMWLLSNKYLDRLVTWMDAFRMGYRPESPEVHPGSGGPESNGTPQ
jgi:peptidoglycan pentaglycine glycine transferase (the first glycine)